MLRTSVGPRPVLLMRLVNHGAWSLQLILAPWMSVGPRLALHWYLVKQEQCIQRMVSQVVRVPWVAVGPRLSILWRTSHLRQHLM